jgi:hypothetical protein
MMFRESAVWKWLKRNSLTKVDVFGVARVAYQLSLRPGQARDKPDGSGFPMFWRRNKPAAAAAAGDLPLKFLPHVIQGD